jgi:hypothetical protein
MIKKIIELHYSAMMFKQKGIPHDWLGRMTFILKYHLFFIIASFVFNIILALNYRFENKIIYFLIAILLGFFIFYLNDNNMKKFISKFEPHKKYKKVKPIINLINLFLVILFGLIMFYLFIFSFRIQNYI